jgi:hypothetical protein
MTDAILQSDIDLARRLISERLGDLEIVAALQLRRISPDRATRLVRALRQGIDVEPDPPSAVEPFRRTSFRDETDAEEDRNAVYGGRDLRRAGGSKLGFKSAMAAGAVVVSALVLIALFHNGGQLKGAHARSTAEPLPAAADPGRASGLVIEVERDGLRVDGNPVNRTNAFDVLIGILGRPSRTNQVEGSSIYAYDRHGVVLYARNHQSDSVVLYFEAVGGLKGAQAPFSGDLQLGGKPISARTDTKTLSSLPNLDVTEKVTNAIFAGTCDGFSLNFAYLNTTQRLSLVQIDLR